MGQTIRIEDSLKKRAQPTDVVLVVEDDEELRESVCILLERRGFHVASAGNGREALDWIEANGVPRLVLLDLMMPVMDGWRFRRELLTNPQLNHVPVVVISGVADAYDHAKTLEAVDCLVKPINPKRLYEIVSHSMNADPASDKPNGSKK